jgi:hypothetical protein
MSLRSSLLTFPFLAMIAACHQAPPPPQVPDTPIPEQICTDVKKSLDTLQKQGGFEFTDKGEATVEQAAWLAMSDDEKDSVVRALAFRNGCTSGRQAKDQEVTIRNEEGMVLTHRFISTKVDPMSALQGGE